jgi:hypothetical protein
VTALLATHQDLIETDAHPIPEDCLLLAPDVIPALSLDRVYKLFGSRRRVRAALAAIASGARSDRETLKSATASLLRWPAWTCMSQLGRSSSSSGRPAAASQR